MMKKSLRKKIIVIALLISLGIIYIPNHKYENVVINEIDCDNLSVRCFSYSLGHVYIGDYASIQAIAKEANENDILIIDFRKIADPDMQVLQSYRIKDIDVINEILEIMLFYEESDPTLWNRTLNSMRNEWEIHNYSYMFKYDIGRTRDVDLNNADEDKYSSSILKKILRN